MKQLVFIHGGETFDSYDEYLDALRLWEYGPELEVQKRWKHTLAEKLADWQVFAPTMPSKYNAKYPEWSIWFEKVIPHLRDGVVLVGHSLGGIFLAKYLDEHRLPVTVRATYLIGAPFDVRDTEFRLPESLDGFAQNGGELVLYHSEDDQVVPFDALGKYQHLLRHARVRIFKDKGHFLQEEFPELVQDIRDLT